MSDSDWLSIREAMDSRFRCLPLARKFMQSAADTQVIVDLGCGTGTNCRYLSSVSHAEALWLCIDKDSWALEAAAKRLPNGQVGFKQGDLATDLELIPFRDEISITASAFLDLTSQDWIHRFASRCERIPLLISMTTSGGPTWDPIDDFDEAIDQCLENHRASDQGFGPAVATDASRLLANDLTSRGCDVSLEASDWQLDDQDNEVIDFLIDGIGRRASKTLPHEQVEAWMKKRRNQNRGGNLKLTIPHLDLLSLPRLKRKHSISSGETPLTELIPASRTLGPTRNLAIIQQ
jgi:SAM-dependent methyltransferase